ncbi:hypothetical protein ACOBV9_22360 (plasmid) [Pseudoalteromonas espejiana]
MATHNPKATTESITQSSAKNLIRKTHQALLDDFWQHCLRFGRLPANVSLNKAQLVRKYFTNHKIKHLACYKITMNQVSMSKSETKRKHDLLVYFA